MLKMIRADPKNKDNAMNEVLYSKPSDKKTFKHKDTTQSFKTNIPGFDEDKVNQEYQLNRLKALNEARARRIDKEALRGQRTQMSLGPQGSPGCNDCHTGGTSMQKMRTQNTNRSLAVKKDTFSSK